MQLELEVPEIPERHRLVGGPRGQDELRVGVEAQAVHLRLERDKENRQFCSKLLKKPCNYVFKN